MRYLPFLLALALTVYALVDCVQTPSHEVRRLSKPVWLAVIVLIVLFGPLAWLLLGRPSASAPPRRVTPPPLAPDDDPDFLRQIRQVDEEHERMLRQWEDDLRRRERGLHDDDDPPAPG